MSENAVTDVADEVDAADEVSNQYVTFNLNDEAFAFPMAHVLEIVRVPETVAVPLTPPSLVGLANLRGSVLPVLDLRRILALPESDYNEATRVIVVDAGRPVGLVVDKVARVLNVEDRHIETAEQVRATIDAELLNGVAKNIDGQDLIQLLDIDRSIRSEFSTVIEAVSVANGSVGGVAELADAGAGSDEEDDTSQLVSFVVDGQEYAFDIAEVEEIVRVPEEISQVPHAERHVLGLINLRGQLLPLVSLRRMFALHESELTEHNRILVVSLQHGGTRRESVGIVVDQVREVLRVPQDVQDKVPSLLRQGSEMDEIGAVCRLDGGKRLVSVLSAGALFQHPSIQQAIDTRDREMQESDMQGEVVGDDVRDDVEDDETQLVVFVLADQEFSVSIDSVQEITRVPEEMTRVPKTPDFIEGLVNLRGSVLPVLDMRTRFGLERMPRNDRQRILVLDLNGVRTGFVTDAVLEVLRLSRALIESAPPLSDEQARIMGRVVNFRDRKRMIQVLDVDELLDKSEVSAVRKVAR